MMIWQWSAMAIPQGELGIVQTGTQTRASSQGFSEMGDPSHMTVHQ
jgi:hypothetical protein